MNYLQQRRTIKIGGLLLVLQFLAAGLYSQAPPKINYQGIARDSSGIALINQTIGLKFEFRLNGTVLSSETQASVPTNALGLFSTQIGTSGLSASNLQGGNLFLEVFLDINNGAGFKSTGLQQLVSVPYALHAATVPSSYTNNILTISGNSYTLSSTGSSSPQTTLTSSGIGTVSSTGTNTFDINIPAPVYNQATGALTTGTVVTNITPTINFSNNVLTVGPSNNSISIPSGTFAATPNTSITGSGAATVTSLAVNSFSVNVPVTTLTPGTNIGVTGSYPNFTISASPTLAISSGSISISGGNSVPLPGATAPTLAISNGSLLSTTGGNTVTLPTASFSPGGAVSISTLSNNSYSISVPNTTISQGANVSVLGSFPSYTISSTASSPTLAIANGSLLSTTGGNTVTLPTASFSPGGAVSISTLSNNSYSISVPNTTISQGGNISVLGSFPSYTISSTASSPTLAIANGSLLSTTGGNTVTLPTASFSPGGAVSISTLSNNSYSISVPNTTISQGGNISVLGSFPSYTISSTASSPTLAISNGSLLSTTGGNTVTLPTASFSPGGAVSISTLSNNSYSISVPQSTLTISGNNLSINDGNTVTIAPTLSASGNTLTVGPATNTISLPTASAPTITPSGIASVTTSGSSFTIGVVQPTFAYSQTTGSLTSGTSSANITPVLSLSGTTLTSGPASNSVTIPTNNANIITQGIATSTASGNNFTIAVAQPTFAYSQATGSLTSGTSSAYITPSVSMSGSTLTVGPPSNSVNISAFSPWTANSASVVLTSSNNFVGIGTNNPAYVMDILGTTGPRLRIFSQDVYWAGVLAKNSTHEYFMGVQATSESASGVNSGFHIFDNTVGVQRMVIDATGNMGIANTSPTQKLDVSGNIKFSGALMPNNTAGTAGQFLQSSGAGAAPVWTTATSGWGLTGNAGTSTLTNFIGTTDNTALVFKVNSLKSGLIDPVGSSANTYFGHMSGLALNTSGANNAGFGFGALMNSTNGSQNSAFGYGALSGNTTGNFNVGVGYNALAGNTSGGFNIAVGSAALLANTTGSYNTTVGHLGLSNNALGVENTSMGYNALSANTNGSYNTAIGSGALQSNTIGSYNIAHGYRSGFINTTGSNNVFLGYNSNASSNNLTNATAVGANATVTASNRVKLGNAASVEFDQALMPAGLAGTSGQFLQSAGAGSPPVWVAAPSSTFAYSSSTGSLISGTSSVSITQALSYSNGIVTSGPSTNSLDITGIGGWVQNTNTVALAVASSSVGIGTTTPGQKLDVVGNMKLSGAFMPANSAGTAGQYLISQGTGAAPVWSTVASSSGWGLTGNAGINTSTNFLGTTDAKDLIFKTNNAEAVRIYTTGNLSVANAGQQGGRLNISMTSATAYSYGIHSTVNYNPASGGGGLVASGYFLNQTSASGGGTQLNTAITGYLSINGSNSSQYNTGGWLHAISSGGSHSSIMGVMGTYENYGGTISNAYGGYFEHLTNSGSINNGYGVYVGSILGNNKWSLYASDASARSYFAGSVGIGVSAPSTTFAIGNGSTEKFNISGTNGSMNFLDDQASITFFPSGASPAPMLYFFNTGTANADRMVLAHSPGYPTWGIQYQDASDKMNFLSAGTTVLGIDLGSQKVGVGTNSPTASFHVVGSTRLVDGTQGTGKVLTSDANGNASWQTAGSSTGWALTGNSGTSAGTNFIGTTDAQSLYFKTNNTTAAIINTSGYMGLGTLTPVSMLQLDAGTSSATALSITHGRDVIGGALPFQIDVSTTSQTYGVNTYARAMRFIFNSSATLYDFGFSSIGDLYLSRANNYTSPDFLISTGGNIGIGTGTATAKLHVNGTMRLVDGTQGAGKVLTSDASGNATWQSATTSSTSICILKDIKSNGTDGGTFTAGAWQTRDLNTIEGSAALVTLSGNQFTLQPGTYLIQGEAPVYNVNLHKAKLRNMTDGTDAIIGRSAYADAAGNGENVSIIKGVITITSAKGFQLQHYSGTTKTANGFGRNTSFGVSEVYSQLEIRKLD